MPSKKLSAKKIELAPRAIEEFKESVQWYFDQSESAADYFVGQIFSRILFIAQHAESFPIVKRSFRETTVFKFPFTIIYTIVKNKVVIHSIFHTSRNPKKKFRK